MKPTKPKNLYKILLIATVGVLVGRGYQLCFFDGPLRTLLWDQGLLETIVTGIFGMPWHDYATSNSVDFWINTTHRIMGALMFLTAISLVIPTSTQLKKVGLKIGFGILCLLGLLGFKEKFFQLPMLFEYMLQLSAPIGLLHFLNHERITPRMVLFMKACASLTFIGHGLYATGIYVRPGKFIDLVIGTFHCSETIATTIVLIAGILDLIVAILIFLPVLSKKMLLYMAIWGGLTALSRLTAGVYFDFFWQSFNQSFFLVVYRIPHALIPLTLFYLLQGRYAPVGSSRILKTT